MILKSLTGSRLFKPLVFFLCLLPLAKWVWMGFQQNLGANPAETLIRGFGDWALYLLLIGLMVTPARKLLNVSVLIRVRRMIGLFAFFYACLHLLAYVWFDQYFNFSEIVKDIIKRPFITIGFINFLALLLLALTSNKWMIKRLKHRWARLHQLVYPVSMLAILHYYMMIKADYLWPVVFALLLLLLLAYRVIDGNKTIFLAHGNR